MDCISMGEMEKSKVTLTVLYRTTGLIGVPFIEMGKARKEKQVWP